jgi:hypothetical protein
MNSQSNFARHYRSKDRRLCARRGCGAPATATLRFQSTAREAWLVAIDRDAPRAEGDLCSRHAEALVLPRGWTLRDERALRLVENAPLTDLDKQLDARTPLLQRAFQNVRSAG